MDGTLTHAVHNFDDIRRRLDLPPGKPILESIAALPADQADAVHRRLYEIELKLARRAAAQPGVERLLERLRDADRCLGVVTRNSEALAHVTLDACGLGAFFEPAHVVGRERCPPKPDPAGVLLLKELWRASHDDMIMVGDYLFDLEAGRGAGAMTVHFNRHGDPGWPEHSDITISDFAELMEHLHC